MIVFDDDYMYDFEEDRYLALAHPRHLGVEEEWVELKRITWINSVTREIQAGWQVKPNKVTMRPQGNSNSMERAYQKWLIAEAFER